MRESGDHGGGCDNGRGCCCGGRGVVAVGNRRNLYFLCYRLNDSILDNILSDDWGNNLVEVFSDKRWRRNVLWLRRNNQRFNSLIHLKSLLPYTTKRRRTDFNNRNRMNLVNCYRLIVLLQIDIRMNI